MSKKLISLEEHNNIAHQKYREDKKTANGIACPECGEELHDITGITLVSSPPKVKTECRNPSCSYKGNRIK